MSVVVVDADGERNESLGYAMKASRDEEIEANLRPGQEMRFRVLVPVPQNVAGKTLLINEPEGRVYAVDISGVK